MIVIPTHILLYIKHILTIFINCCGVCIAEGAFLFLFETSG